MRLAAAGQEHCLTNMVLFFIPDQTCEHDSVRQDFALFMHAWSNESLIKNEETQFC